jgi:hypothetical protein
MLVMNVTNLFPTIALSLVVLLMSVGDARSATTPGTTNRISRWLNGKSLPHLDLAQAEAYVRQQQRRPEALLAAFQASTDHSFLREAMAKFPRDRRVAMAGAFHSGSADANTGIHERRQWLDAFKKTAPDNALAYLLSARDYFKAGQPEMAEKEVQASIGKAARDYAVEFIENTEAAYASAGYSDSEAIALAMGSLLMPHLAQLRDLSSELIKRANHYRQRGDVASANRMLQAAIRIGAQLDTTNSFTLLQSLVGISIQQSALKELSAGATLENSRVTPQAEMDRLAQRRSDLRGIARDFNKLFEQMSDKEMGNYFNRQKQMGEEAADRQLLAKARP